MPKRKSKVTSPVVIPDCVMVARVSKGSTADNPYPDPEPKANKPPLIDPHGIDVNIAYYYQMSSMTCGVGLAGIVFCVTDSLDTMRLALLVMAIIGTLSFLFIDRKIKRINKERSKNDPQV